MNSAPRLPSSLVVTIATLLIVFIGSPTGWRLASVIQVAHWSPIPAWFGRLFVGATFPFMLLWLALRIVAPLVALIYGWKKVWFQAAFWTIIALTAWLSWPISRAPQWAQWRRAGLLSASQRAVPLIEAIEKYHRRNNRYPANLQELVPQYLPSVPATGMVSYPEFRYSAATNDSLFRQYELKIRTSSGFINFDDFFYWPEKNYPAFINRERIERIGDWAYLHE